MTTPDLIRAYRAMAMRRPFRPFVIELHSGDRILVSHPEAVARNRDLFIYHGPDRSDRMISGSGVSQLIAPPPAPPAS